MDREDMRIKGMGGLEGQKAGWHARDVPDHLSDTSPQLLLNMYDQLRVRQRHG